MSQLLILLRIIIKPERDWLQYFELRGLKFFRSTNIDITLRYYQQEIIETYQN